MGACPSRSLARNAALTGDAFTRCPDRRRFYLLPRYRAIPRTRLFPQPRRASFSCPSPGRIFFIHHAKKHLHFQINLINILPLPF